MKQRGFLLIELLIILCIVGILIASAVMPSVTCENTAKEMGLEWRWGWTTSCMVKHKGQWMPLKSVRSVD